MSRSSSSNSEITRRRRRRMVLGVCACSLASLMVVDAFRVPDAATTMWLSSPSSSSYSSSASASASASFASSSSALTPTFRSSPWGAARSRTATAAAANSRGLEASRLTRLFAEDDRRNATFQSTSSASGRRSSPLQVRRRVRAVLERARSRTGIENTSAKPSNIVADAATLGGLGDGTGEYMVGMKRKNGTAQPKLNGASNPKTKASEPLRFPDEDLEWMKTEPNGDRPKNGQVKVNGNGNTNTNGGATATAAAANGVAVVNGDSKPAATAQTAKSAKTDAKQSSPALDVINGDVPAAAAFCEPLPFSLPKLSQDQIRKLQQGERVQEQSRMGREGSGYVILDVKAPPYVVWECLLDFETYPETIPTVRDMQLFTNEKLNTGYVNEKPVLPGTGRETRHYGTPSVTRAAFVLSKFRLNIAAIHKYTPHPEGDYMEFTLDPSCTNMVLKGAKGIWYTEEAPEGREDYTRVYLLCEVQISRALPSFIVDYAADRAMPRATTWLRPQVEAAADLWLKPRN